MASQRYDLHVRSSASGGTLAPREVVALAAERGLAGIALTDEATVEGVAEARAMARLLGLELIDGLELVVTTPDFGELNILGFYVTPDDPALAVALSGRQMECAAAVDSIHRAGGVAVLARPGIRFKGDKLDAVVEFAVKAGIDGIEVDHPEHNEDAVRRSVELAERYDLVQTSGSDDRGSGVEGPRLGCRTVTKRAIDQLHARARRS
jgi:predicted metal-dependent phosphoesterase TrpH